eukprot:Tbor_TRINITY_DN3919_c0_g1::TRINITY_DN3919_c0_g1_i1::g.702::m.702
MNSRLHLDTEVGDYFYSPSHPNSTINSASSSDISLAKNLQLKMNKLKEKQLQVYSGMPSLKARLLSREKRKIIEILCRAARSKTASNECHDSLGNTSSIVCYGINHGLSVSNGTVHIDPLATDQDTTTGSTDRGGNVLKVRSHSHNISGSIMEPPDVNNNNLNESYQKNEKYRCIKKQLNRSGSSDKGRSKYDRPMSAYTSYWLPQSLRGDSITQNYRKDVKTQSHSGVSEYNADCTTRGESVGFDPRRIILMAARENTTPITEYRDYHSDTIGSELVCEMKMATVHHHNENPPEDFIQENHDINLENQRIFDDAVSRELSHRKGVLRGLSRTKGKPAEPLSTNDKKQEPTGVCGQIRNATESSFASNKYRNSLKGYRMPLYKQVGTNPSKNQLSSSVKEKGVYNTNIRPSSSVSFANATANNCGSGDNSSTSLNSLMKSVSFMDPMLRSRLNKRASSNSSLVSTKVGEQAITRSKSCGKFVSCDLINTPPPRTVAESMQRLEDTLRLNHNDRIFIRRRASE